MRTGRVISDIRKTSCERDADCRALICPLVIGSDTPICKDGKCWCGSKRQSDVSELQELFNETPANKTQKGLQRTAEEYNETEIGRIVRETGNLERERGTG